MTVKVIPCPGCAKPLNANGCMTRGCMFGPHSGYTLPPPPKFTDMPDPFPDVCKECGQPVPKKH